MADLTARLVWYRLGECYRNFGERYERFQEWCAEDFSWRRVDLLDMLFLGWLVAAFLVVGAINLYLRFFGLPRNKNRRDESVHPSSTVKGGESVQWINSALSWLYLHYNSTPELIESWLRALNEQTRKHPVSLLFTSLFTSCVWGTLGLFTCCRPLAWVINMILYPSFV